MKQITPDQLDWLIGLLRAISARVPAVTTLVAMIGLDIFSGLLLACSRRSLNSTVSWQGMMRKAMTILLVAMAMLLEPYANGLPLSMLVAVGFIVTEGQSILENAAALGLPMPQSIVDVLEKLQKGRKERMIQKSGDRNALDANTAALKERIAQTEEMKVVPQKVIVEAPVDARIINPENDPAHVVIEKKG